ncbi:MAG TPA: hypothetical protein VK933_15650 [Longimicrobiales bacterium]|nr:hypothetical protein [Longimicrobiales bacterium]
MRIRSALPPRFHARGGWPLPAALLGLTVGCGAAGAGAEAGVEYKPGDDVPRLESVALHGDDIGLVRDFEIAGDTVYLLDATGRVAVIQRDAGALRLTGHIARPGPGPGELQRPTGIALSDSAIVVVDGARLQFFDRAGVFLESRPLTLPCAMMLPAVAAGSGGLFVHGGCLQRGVVADTMKAVLAWSQDTTTWDVVVATPRYTSDGSLGNVFGVRSLLTTGPAGVHVFGGGEMNCIWKITDSGSLPGASETCPAAAALYSAAPPPGLEERMRSARFAGMNIRWPETLPAYIERFVAGDAIVLLRPFAADSLVLQAAAPGSADFAVAPMEGLIGCRSGGCLWLLEDSDVPRLIVLDRASIEAMINGEVE